MWIYCLAHKLLYVYLEILKSLDVMRDEWLQME